MKSQTINWYQLKQPEQIDSPALLVFPERVKCNIQTAISMVGNADRLRPHIKTCKSPDAVKLMQDAGIKKFKCATISEAEMLGMAGADDVLLAYQPTGPKLSRFIQLVKKYPNTDFSCLTDNLAIAREITEQFQNEKLRVSVYIDLNTGMNRTGIELGNKVIELMKFLDSQDSVKIVGWHVYDGHINHPDFSVRQIQSNDNFKLVEQLLAELKKVGLHQPPIIAGGSPTFPIHAKRMNIECSPGTFVYWDKSYVEVCAEQDFLPAVVMLTRVISLPGPDLITTDLGHKSVASENSLNRRAHILNDEALEPISHSEEHLVLKNNGTNTYSIGDVLYALPYHVCPTVALYERLFAIENGVPIGEWMNVARDRKIQI